MKKLAFAAAVIAATAFSGSAFAVPADSAKGLQVSSDAVKVGCYRPVRHYRRCCVTRVYVVKGCGCYTCGCWGGFWLWPF